MPDLVPALLLFLLPLAYSPGPGNLFFAATGARFGLAATLPASLGYHAATLAVTLVLGAGFLGAVAASPLLGSLMRWGGAAYVLWLAAGFARAGVLRDAPEARPATARDGALLLLLNPKAYLIIVLMFGSFGAEAATLPGATLLIAAVFTLNNLVAFTLWTLAGDLLGRWFRDAGAARRLNLAFAALLAGVALWLAVG